MIADMVKQHYISFITRAVPFESGVHVERNTFWLRFSNASSVSIAPEQTILLKRLLAPFGIAFITSNVAAKKFAVYVIDHYHE